MAQQLETGVGGEGDTDSMSIKEWMNKIGKPLSSKTIQILNDECIQTVYDMLCEHIFRTS